MRTLGSAPTPTSSPRASPTPPDSDDKNTKDIKPEVNASHDEPSTITPELKDDSDDMEIDEDVASRSGPSHKYPTTTESDPSPEGQADDNTEWSSDDWMADMRRVKVYELVGSDGSPGTWTDRGTGFVTGTYSEELGTAAIVAKSEMNDVELLRSEIRISHGYQRQQDTLIVWTEPSGIDFALSFQDMEGCAEIWDFITEVQRHFRGQNPEGSNSPPTTSGLLHPQSRLTVASIVASGRLPDPALGIISELDAAIKVISKSNHGKERICEYILNEDYIKSLIDVMEQAEDLESLPDLHAIYGIMHTILTMNDHGIYDYVLQEDVFLGVVGILEYDPEFPTCKAGYRDFLRKFSQFKQVIEIKDDSVQRKVHQTYRLQYLKDVVLARILDDSTFNVLNSFIIFNQIDIINHIQHDDVFLRDIFAVFDVESPSLPNMATQDTLKGKPYNGSTSSSAPVVDHAIFSLDPTTISQRKIDVIHFMHQLCLMGKNVQIPTRLALYRSLIDRGLLSAIEWVLGRASDVSLLDAAGEVLVVVVDHDIARVRGHILTQIEGVKAKDNDSTKGTASPSATITPKGHPNLLISLMKTLGGTKVIPFRSQIGDSLRILVELPNLEMHAPGEKSLALARMREDPTTERFLQIFYDNCISTLFKPLIDIVEYKDLQVGTLKLHREQSSLFLYLCDLLCTFLVQHSHRSQYFVLSSNISSRISSLFRAKDKHVRLAALRFFRVCLRMNNNFIHRHLMKHDLFSSIVDLAERESQRDNLVTASCQEFFEHVRRENIKIVLNHIMEKSGPRIRALAELPIVGQRMKAFIRRWEQNNEPMPKSESPNDTISTSTRKWGQGNLLESEEESYFNTSDDEDGVSSTTPWTRAQQLSAQNLKRKRSMRGGPPSGNRHQRSNSLSSVSDASSRIPSDATQVQGQSEASTSTPKNHPTRLPISVPQPYPLQVALVDYEDDDDLGGLGQPTDEPGHVLSSTLPSSRTQPSTELMSSSPSAINPAHLVAVDDGPSLELQRSDPKPSSPNSTLREPTSGTPHGPDTSATSKSRPAAPLKRRREDNDDDEMLSLLTKGKRKSAGPGKPTGEALHALGGVRSIKDDGGKRIKFARLGGAALHTVEAPTSLVVSATPPLTSVEKKRGDEG